MYEHDDTYNYRLNNCMIDRLFKDDIGKLLMNDTSIDMSTIFFASLYNIERSLNISTLKDTSEDDVAKTHIYGRPSSSTDVSSTKFIKSPKKSPKSIQKDLVGDASFRKYVIDFKELKFPKNIRLFSNKNASCYIDSLVIFFFFNKSDVWRESIFESTLHKKDYVNYSYICEGRSKINDQDTLYELAIDIRSVMKKELKKLYNVINDNTNNGYINLCHNLRELVHRCLPSTRVNNVYTYQDIAKIYDFFSDIFPSLKFKSNQILSDGEVRETKFSSMAISDYMLNRDMYIDSDNDHICFSNTIRQIKNMTQLGTEYVPNVSKYSTIQEKIIEKIRTLDMNITISNNNDNTTSMYELVGVVFFNGIILQTEETSGHYTSMFKVDNNNDDNNNNNDSSSFWYYYDDMTSNAVRVDQDVRSLIFNNDDNRFPQMLFYSKIKNIPRSTSRQKSKISTSSLKSNRLATSSLKSKISSVNMFSYPKSSPLAKKETKFTKDIKLDLFNIRYLQRPDGYYTIILKNTSNDTSYMNEIYKKYRPLTVVDSGDIDKKYIWRVDAIEYKKILRYLVNFKN
jgi:hypothetical protein